MALKKSPYLVEIIGLAGSGKSTLSHALGQYDLKLQVGERFITKNIKYTPFLVRHGIMSAPIFFGRPRQGRWFTWEEFKKVVYLKGWHRVLERQALRNDSLILVDQGPIFELATLHEFGPEKLKSPNFKSWWETVFEQWAAALGLVIWLKAPENILIERIRGRGQWHLVKNSPVQEARDFLSRYQAAYDRVMSKLMDCNNLRIVQFDTSSQLPESIVERVMVALDGMVSEANPPGLASRD